ncbi:hypothetical protein MLD38_004940 [Melastoma candidum]|uniref:Uncharacterized protein n=1 Tax=Melastoma candidum TaxID=119954 RepID=A0ACB9S856_9MYRT|nr:hypothetical protein MLD38_004940 [Melastoma candidum]
MSASRPKPQSSSTTESQTFDETKWLIQIRRTLEEELEEDNEVPVNVFCVPKLLLSSHPELYTPQQVAIGPYHHWRPELYEMERYKIAAAKRTQKRLRAVSYHNLVDQIVKLESRTRACYHKYLDFNGETLAWMLAIDASFLLEFLQVYAVQQGKILARVSSRMSHLLDHEGRKFGHNAILRDVVMLENQIPLFILRKIMESQFTSLEEADEVLNSMLIGFCKEISPFKTIIDSPRMQVLGSGHVLDFLYHYIIAKPEQPSETAEDDQGNEEEDSIGEQPDRKSPTSSDNTNYMKQPFDYIWGLLSKLNDGPIQFLKGLLLSNPVQFLLKLPWAILSRIPIVSMFVQPIGYLFFSEETESKPKKETTEDDSEATKPPLVEEIAIPSVRELTKAGFRFSPTDGGKGVDIGGIRVEEKTMTLYLPRVTVDANTEGLMRNLVAYEAWSSSGPLVLTRYTELMNGIIDEGEDVRLLREAGVVVNRMKSDGEAAGMWNGMSKSIRLTKVRSLDKAIEDVDRCYNSRLRVKVGKYLRSYVFGSWRLLTLLACVILLLLMSLQAFCSVYNCARFFRINTT